MRYRTLAITLGLMVMISGFAPAAAAGGGAVRWVSFPDGRLQVCGLQWFAENSPELWRLPKSSKDLVPKAVWNRGLAPDGGRIRFSSDTSRLLLRAKLRQGPKKPCYFDAYVGGELAGSGRLTETDAAEVVLFEGIDRSARDVTIYLPNNHEVLLLAVGLDEKASLTPPRPYAVQRPIVCYGSSVMQGTGATHPGHTYPAALARRLDADFVNLGFGGAGKAEPAVVTLVSGIDASCFIFDLGKSYGAQPEAPFRNMLAAVRAAHPRTPIVCVTPIYSLKEENEPAYRTRSEDLRRLMRHAASDMKDAGDKLVFISEGLDLFGERDKDAFNDPLHPNDEGNDRMAERLAGVVESALRGSRATGAHEAGVATQP